MGTAVQSGVTVLGIGREDPHDPADEPNEKKEVQRPDEEGGDPSNRPPRMVGEAEQARDGCHREDGLRKRRVKKVRPVENVGGCG